jgi:hypothetical protein
MQTSSLSSLSRRKSVRVFYLFPSRLCKFHQSNPSISQTPNPHLPHPCARSPPSFWIISSYTVPQVTPSVLRPIPFDMSLLLIATFKFGTENLFSSNIPGHHLAFRNKPNIRGSFCMWLIQSIFIFVRRAFLAAVARSVLRFEGTGQVVSAYVEVPPSSFLATCPACT